jgi:hypothetical protein
MAQHPTTEGLRIVDRDPQAYVDAAGNRTAPARKDTSLGIGSLKGR